MKNNWEYLANIVVIITTRNRIHELQKTIESCISIGLSEGSLFITDDASTDNTVEIVRRQFPGVRIKENQTPMGYIRNRNEMMRNSAESFILSLDDDSNLMSREDLVEALEILSSDQRYGVFGFLPVEQVDQPPAKEFFTNEIFQSTTYIGCGHIIKRSAYKLVGGYREELVFYGEEFDFSIRCYKAGLLVIKKADLIVHHRVDYKERAKKLKDDKSKGEYSHLWRSELLMANKLTRIFFYYPFLVLPYYASKTIIGYFYLFVLKNKLRPSYTNALKRVAQRRNLIMKDRDPLTVRQFFTYIRLREN